MHKSLRYLRITWSVVCGIACVLLIALWVRSYWWQDTVSWRYYTPKGVHTYTIPGRFYFDTFIDQPHQIGVGMGFSHSYWDPAFRMSSVQLTDPTAWHLYAGPRGNPLLIPFWTSLVMVAAVAAVPWIHWSRRFSLRTLLIATTLVAAVLGLIVYAIR